MKRSSRHAGADLWRHLRQCRNDAGDAHSDDDGGMVENAKARVSQRGNRFLNLTLSDRSGQFQSSCFDEQTCKLLETLAADGGCAILSVELDLFGRRGETPRVTVRGAQPLAEIAATAALELTCRVSMPEAIGDMARLLEKRDDARGKVIVVADDRVRERCPHLSRPPLCARSRRRRGSKRSRGSANPRWRWSLRAIFGRADCPSGLPNAPSRLIRLGNRRGKAHVRMQGQPLLVTSLIDHAAREHAGREIVSRWADGSVTRSNWGEVGSDARRLPRR